MFILSGALPVKALSVSVWARCIWSEPTEGPPYQSDNETREEPEPHSYEKQRSHNAK